jgi:hypothetical protein
MRKFENLVVVMGFFSFFIPSSVSPQFSDIENLVIFNNKKGEKHLVNFTEEKKKKSQRKFPI